MDSSTDSWNERRRRRLLFAALYLCEGAPIGFLWFFLPTILRERGLELERIGALTSWLVLPWALKFLWAPAIDSGRGPGLRAWIAGAQCCMALALLPLLWLDPEADFGWLVAALVLHAVAAASQDAAIDSLAIRTTPVAEQGQLNGWMQVGMLLGRSTFGGGALFARQWLSDRALVLGLSGGLLLGALLLATRGPRTSRAVRHGAERTFSLHAHLAAALRGRRTWCGLLFAATSGAGFEVVGALAGPMLIDHQVPSATIGAFFGLPAVAAMALGAVLGGRASDRLGVRKTVLASGLGLGALVFVLAWLVHADAAPASLLAGLGAIYLGIGFFTASSYALFMSLTDPALGATQFSAFMGATNLCESWSARAGSSLAARVGYGNAFAWPAAVGILSLPLLLVLSVPRRADEPE